MHILIVEDEEALARNLKKLLELRGFGVDWLASAEKARIRVLLYRNEYDMIILDLTLRGMDGMAFTKDMPAEGITTPIIIVTGNSDTKNKIELLNSGADDYVVKPFSSDELIARMSSVLRRPVMEQPIVHKLGSLTIDTAARRVNVGETPRTPKKKSGEKNWGGPGRGAPPQKGGRASRRYAALDTASLPYDVFP